MLDGAGSWRILISVILPQSIPVVTTVALQILGMNPIAIDTLAGIIVSALGALLAMRFAFDMWVA